MKHKQTSEPDIVERLRKNAERMYVNELRSDAADAGIYRSWKNTATEAAAEIERLRALPSRSDVLEEADRVARETGAHFLTNRDAYVLHGPAAIVAGIVQAIRALKSKDTDNG